MKKNISINISGIIFHIEEDGYDSLKKYLDSIQKYFSSFDDSAEILADIEGRIAEIFLSRLNEEKQVITLEDVSNLMATMGSVSDFKAAEAQETDDSGATDPQADTSTSEDSRSYSGAGSTAGAYAVPKSLLRDEKRKILGGVCAGLGSYLNVDPVWIRLLFALLFFAYGITLLIYVIMWLIVPGSYDLDEPVSGKKMYRDPERKVIAGVSGGLAAYLGIDIIAVRILFIIFFFVGGVGLFLYIVLWIILPEARTLTDRVRMQGEPVTLSNIESTFKKNRSEAGHQEDPVTRIVLFPFRLIGMILTALARILNPLVDVLRIVIGIILVICGLGMIFGLVVSAGALTGLFTAASFAWPWGDPADAAIPVDVMVRSFPVWTAVAAFVASIVPAIFIVLLGFSATANRIVFGAAAGWTLFVLFFVSVAVLAVSVPKIVISFHEDGVHRVDTTYALTGAKSVFRINETGLEKYDVVRLDLRGHDEQQFRLRQAFEARGRSRNNAIENARMVTYNVDVQDSVFTFDSNLTFSEDAVFRAQQLDMILYIPYGHPFMMDEEFARFVTNYVDCCGWDGFDEVYRYTWVITEEAGLTCIDCPHTRPDEDHETPDQTSWTSPVTYDDFNEIEITGNFNLTLTNSDEYAVNIHGSDRRYRIYRTGRTLVIAYDGPKKIKWNSHDVNVEEIHLDIALPELEKIEANGMGTVKFVSFRSDDVEIEGRGPVKVRGDLLVDRLTIDLTGNSEANLSGQVDRMNARLQMASTFRGYDLDVRDAVVEASGFSTARVTVREHLQIEEGIASKVDFRGNPRVTWID